MSSHLTLRGEATASQAMRIQHSHIGSAMNEKQLDIIQPINVFKEK